MILRPRSGSDARHLLIKQTYGDWQNMSGVAVASGSRMHSLRETRGLLLTLSDHRKPTLPSDPSEVSIYHALIFYPNGYLPAQEEAAA